MTIRAGRPTYAGLALVALATLAHEILLTRIFSVTMWYHFAFVAISVAMFGMSVGALAVYLMPARFTSARAPRQMAVHALLFSCTIVVSFVLHLLVPFEVAPSLSGLLTVGFTYVVISVPFYFVGVCFCLALTRFPAQVGKLYGADLAGAALGCVALGLLLRVTDGPTAVLFVAALAALGALGFSLGAGSRSLVRLSGGAALLLTLVAAGHTVLVHQQRPLFRITWVKGAAEPPPIYEKWNPFSRITIYGEPETPSPVFGWGVSPTFPKDRLVRQLMILIDASAGTIMTGYDGTPESTEHLRYDLTNLVHYVRSDGRVLVVGVGGGRDLLSALIFGQREAIGVEMNGVTLEAAHERFAEFTGNLAADPRVRLVHDEARSWLARQDDRFDVIQLSLTDTWAATSAGAYVLGENSLYTVEAWELFLDRLTPDGIVTCSRWYFHDRPGEVYRLTALAAAALAAGGVEEPRRHMVLLRTMFPGDTEVGGLGTLLVRRSPFTDEELDAIDEVAERLAFEVMLTPDRSADRTLQTLASGRDLEEFAASYPIDISPPTDDRPFFFQMLRPGDLLAPGIADAEMGRINMQAVFVLVALLLTVLVLTAVCILFPLLVARRKDLSRDSLGLLAFFASIGFGFMLVEISQMQRLTVFLGHPTYGLSVVLFAVLLSGGLGSRLTQSIAPERALRAGALLLAGLLVVVAAFGLLTPTAIRAFAGAGTAARIGVALALLAPLGLFLGMAFPLGMKIAAPRFGHLTAWLWGINGATSVCASVLAVVVALAWGISAAFWLGAACYAVGWAAFVIGGRKATC